MNKIFLILIFAITITAKSSAEDNEELIDFWTNTHDEIIIHFRYNQNTQELEIQQQESGQETEHKSHNEKTVTAANKDLSKSHPKESHETLKMSEDKYLLNLNLDKIQPGLEIKLKTKEAESVASSPTNAQEIDEAAQTKDEGESGEIAAESKPANEETRVEASITPNPLSLEACSRNCSHEPHIACGHTWTFSPNCPASSTVLNLDPFKESLLLHLHNDLRHNLAGNLTQFEPASRMATMQWHDELAEYALLNALQCDMEHDWCHHTKEFHHTGQNLAWKRWTNPHVSVETILKKMFNDWYAESQYARQMDLDSCQGNGEDMEIISHFTTIVNERNTHVGCGAVQTIVGRRKTLYLTCNYARNNIMGMPIYVKGPTGSGCTTGINPLYSNLCSTNELYDYNN